MGQINRPTPTLVSRYDGVESGADFVKYYM